MNGISLKQTPFMKKTIESVRNYSDPENQNNYFNTEHLRTDLKKLVISSGAIITGSIK